MSSASWSATKAALRGSSTAATTPVALKAVCATPVAAATFPQRAPATTKIAAMALAARQEPSAETAPASKRKAPFVATACARSAKPSTAPIAKAWNASSVAATVRASLPRPCATAPTIARTAPTKPSSCVGIPTIVAWPPWAARVRPAAIAAPPVAAVARAKPAVRITRKAAAPRRSRQPNSTHLHARRCAPMLNVLRYASASVLTPCAQLHRPRLAAYQFGSQSKSRSGISSTMGQ